MSRPANLPRTGDELRALRETLGCSQVRLGLELGLSERTILNHEGRGGGELPKWLAWAMRGAFAPVRSKLLEEVRRAEQQVRRVALRRARARRLEELKAEDRVRRAAATAKRSGVREVIGLAEKVIGGRATPADHARLRELDQVLR